MPKAVPNSKYIIRFAGFHYFLTHFHKNTCPAEKFEAFNC